MLSVTAPEVRDAAPRGASWLEAQKSWNTLLVVAVVAIAAVIRFWNLGSLGYQHWDEYYFLTNADAVSRAWPKGLGSIFWVTAPLVPYTDGTLFHLFGTSSWMPLAVSATYGTLAVVAIYLLGLRMFGYATGLIAAAVMATAEFSVMYSRTALADATFDFWLITSVLCIWIAFTRRRFRYWALAGVSSGFLLNTKYDGAFPLILAGSWLIVEFVVDLVVGRRRFVSKAWSEYAPHVAGAAAMVAIAMLLFAPWLLKLEANPGFHAMFGLETGFSNYKTPPNFIFWYYWFFTSPPTVIFAVAGIAVGLVRFTRADRLMLVYTVGWFGAILLFDAYPREALSLLPAVAMWAGRAVVEAWRLAHAWWPRHSRTAAGISAACASVVLIGQFLPLPHLLSLRTLGYADAVAVTDKYQATGATLLVRTQPNAFLYLHQYPYYVARPSSIRDLSGKASAIYFMTDQTLLSHSDLMDFFTLNRDRLVVVDRVPNPLYPEVLLQPATDDRLAHLNDPPDAFRYITIWRATGPLLYPPSWPQ